MSSQPVTQPVNTEGEKFNLRVHFREVLCLQLFDLVAGAGGVVQHMRRRPLSDEGRRVAEREKYTNIEIEWFVM